MGGSSVDGNDGEFIKSAMEMLVRLFLRLTRSSDYDNLAGKMPAG